MGIIRSCRGRGAMARAQIFTNLIYLSSHISALACSFFKFMRRPRILQLFPLIVSELQVCSEGLLRANLYQCQNERAGDMMDQARQTLSGLPNTHASITTQRDEGLLERGNRAEKRMRLPVMRLIRHIEKCRMLGDLCILLISLLILTCLL